MARIDKSLENLNVEQLRELLTHIEEAVEILNPTKKTLLDMNQEGEEFMLTLSLMKVELFNRICKGAGL